MAREKVLIADQDLDHLTKIYLALVHRNFKAEACNNPDEIRDRLKRFKPSVIILTSKEYQQLRDKLKIPAIILVEKGETMSAELNYGDILLNKPVQAEALIKVVDSVT